MRLPGLLRVDRDWSGQVAAVNETKAEVRRVMQVLGTKRWERWERWRPVVPGLAQLCRLQAYRAWTWLDGPLTGAHFLWSGHSTGAKQCRAATLLAELTALYEQAPAPGLARDIEALTALPANEILVIRRPVAPTPAVNLRGPDDAWMLRKGSLPLLMAQPLPTNIKPLADFDPHGPRRHRREGYIEPRPIVAHRHAHRYRPRCRFSLASDPVAGRLTCGEGRPASLLAYSARDSWAIPLIRPTEELDRFAAGVPDVGAAPGHPTLGQAPRQIRLLAANRANLYIEAPGGTILRVPRADLRRLRAKQAGTARLPAV